MGSEISFDTLRPDLITIGSGCCITSGVKIISHFYEPDKHAMFYDSVEIGNKVFIGMNTLIVNSVKIGDYYATKWGAFLVSLLKIFIWRNEFIEKLLILPKTVYAG